jgi:ApeA N-terminal domain 1
LQGKLAAQSVVEGNREVRVIPRGFPWAETEESDEAKMLFTARDLANDLPERVQHWYRRSAELGSVFNLYFATLFGVDMYSEHRFLTLAQAVESYHRLTSEGLILAKPAYKQLRRRLCQSIDLAGVPEGPAKLMKDKLAYLNEISLRERIRSLLTSRSGEITGLIPDIEGFATAVADTRNYLTHFSRRLQTKAATGPDLVRISEQLRYFVELLVLTELGITEAQRAAIVRKRERELNELTFLRA